VSLLQPFLHWLAVHTGTVNEAGPYYGFFSGFGSDIGEVMIITGMAVGAHHANCHVKGCWRWGHPVGGLPYRLCHRHNPDHHGEKRNVAIDHILDQHRQTRR